MENSQVRFRSGWVCLVLGLFLCFTPLSFVHGQHNKPNRQYRKPLGFLFVSPNTRDNLTLAEAKAALTSEEETRLIAEERDLACRLRESLHPLKAIGSWSDGAEHSTVLLGHTNEANLRYAGSWLGKFSRQKAVLYFLQGSQGPGRLYVITLSKKPNLTAVSSLMDANEVSNRTLVPLRQKWILYVVDLNSSLRMKVMEIARKLKARLHVLRGSGAFIGDDDRDKAQQVFATEIQNYQVGNPNLRRPCHAR